MIYFINTSKNCSLELDGVTRAIIIFSSHLISNINIIIVIRHFLNNAIKYAWVLRRVSRCLVIFLRWLSFSLDINRVFNWWNIRISIVCTVISLFFPVWNNWVLSIFLELHRWCKGVRFLSLAFLGCIFQISNLVSNEEVSDQGRNQRS